MGHPLRCTEGTQCAGAVGKAIVTKNYIRLGKDHLICLRCCLCLVAYPPHNLPEAELLNEILAIPAGHWCTLPLDQFYMDYRILLRVWRTALYQLPKPASLIMNVAGWSAKGQHRLWCPQIRRATYPPKPAPIAWTTVCILSNPSTPRVPGTWAADGQRTRSSLARSLSWTVSGIQSTTSASRGAISRISSASSMGLLHGTLTRAPRRLG